MFLFLQGICAKCGSPIGRYLEIGEVVDYSPRISEALITKEKWLEKLQNIMKALKIKTFDLL